MIFTYKISFMTEIDKDNFEKILKSHLDKLTYFDEYEQQDVKRYTIEQIAFEEIK